MNICRSTKYALISPLTLSVSPWYSICVPVTPQDLYVAARDMVLSNISSESNQIQYGGSKMASLVRIKLTQNAE